MPVASIVSLTIGAKQQYHWSAACYASTNTLLVLSMHHYFRWESLVKKCFTLKHKSYPYYLCKNKINFFRWEYWPQKVAISSRNFYVSRAPTRHSSLYSPLYMKIKVFKIGCQCSCSNGKIKFRHFTIF